MNIEIQEKSLKKSSNTSSLDHKFRELIQKIEEESLQGLNYASPRGLKVKESLFTSLSISPYLAIADFQARPFNWKYFTGELAWYLLRSRTTRFIDNFSSFWANLKNPDGSVNSNYGRILFGKQMNWVINSLKNDQDTRQAVAYVGGPDYQYSGNKDFVCTQYLLFFIRKKKLHMKVQMRSNDLFYGLTYDAPFFVTLHQTVYFNLRQWYPDLELGEYFHFSDNTHYYQRHFEVATKILQESPRSKPVVLRLRDPLFWARDIEDDRVDYSATTKEFLLEIDKNLNKLKKLQKEDYLNLLNILYHIDI